jgi:hypothetical protein
MVLMSDSLVHAAPQPLDWGKQASIEHLLDFYSEQVII